MRFAAITSALILGLAGVGLAMAQTPQKASLTGKISVLKVKTITVHGNRSLTCRVTPASPHVRPLGFALGNTVKITCLKGVLSAIKKIVSSTAAPIAPGGTTTTDNTLPSDPIPGTGGVKVAPTVNGAGSITALGSGQIEFGNAISCQLGGNSPSTAGYRVGSRVNYTCIAGMLAQISASEAT